MIHLMNSWLKLTITGSVQGVALTKIQIFISFYFNFIKQKKIEIIYSKHTDLRTNFKQEVRTQMIIC